MLRRPAPPRELAVWANAQRVGTWRLPARGAMEFAYDPAWQQVLIEFRAQAAREPEVNARYAALHARTVEQLADTLDGIYDRAGIPAPASTRTVAEFLLALGNGVTLERAVSAHALPHDDVVTFAGSIGFGVPNALLRADEVFVGDIRLPYQKFNRQPVAP